MNDDEINLPSDENGEDERYVPIKKLCEIFGFSRRTWNRTLNAFPSLEDLIVRVPPPHGRPRIPLRKFEEWLRQRSRKTRRGYHSGR